MIYVLEGECNKCHRFTFYSLLQVAAAAVAFWLVVVMVVCGRFSYLYFVEVTSELKTKSHFSLTQICWFVFIPFQETWVKLFCVQKVIWQMWNLWQMQIPWRGKTWRLKMQIVEISAKHEEMGCPLQKKWVQDKQICHWNRLRQYY